jgi:hypothetical protein
MPPWSWMQSWTSSVACGPTHAAAALASSAALSAWAATAHGTRGDRVARLEPELLVGDPMLERLVRGE